MSRFYYDTVRVFQAGKSALPENYTDKSLRIDFKNKIS